MPCRDVTEILQVELDGEDCLASYQLAKRTCGRAVGEASLILEHLIGNPAREILNLGADEFAEAHPTADDTEEFLLLKHLFALQGGLRVLLGEEPGGIASPVRVARVACEDGRTILESEISVDVVTEQIRACGRCKGCGSIAAKLKAVP